MTADQHLAHLKRLIQPPYTNAWWAYAKARAEELAMEDSAFAALPVMLHAERERIKVEAEASRPLQSTASNSKRTARREIVSRETTPAPIHTAPRKSGTGQPVSS